MGNQNESNEHGFDMHLKVIGVENNRFYELYENSKLLKNIKKYWNFDKIELIDFKIQINNYFSKLEGIKNEARDLKESLIIKVNNSSDPIIKNIIEKLDELENKGNMPIVLFLTKEKEKKPAIKIDWDNYEDVEPRLIFIKNYTEEKFEEEIAPLLLRFCSFHNELGDRFTIGNGDNREDFDLIERYFPFNLNMACVGRSGQGKSTGVNAILNEYKSKEGSQGCSQTKKLTFYQVKNKPIRILDIPGFEDDKTINNAINKIKICNEKIKDNLHIILYFLNFDDGKTFLSSEYPFIEQILKHKTTKIIYVVTKSNSTLNDKNKKKFYNKINTGIQGITKNTPIFNEVKDFFKASEKNTVFVNFHKRQIYNIEPFGKEDLFKKIHDFFVDTEDYKKIKEITVEEEVAKLRKTAKDELLSNKIWGGLVGFIPIVDFVLQKFVIKANAIKKVGEIFGIDVKFIDEEIEANKNVGNDQANENNELNNEINGNTLNEDSGIEMLGNGIKCT